MKTIQFNDKICLVTGASSGIGKALSQKLNNMGATVIITARNRENLEIVKAGCKYPDKILMLPFDMEEIKKIESFALEAWSLFHNIDFVFLNAGMAVRDMVHLSDMEMVYKVMNINFFSQVALSKALLPYMREKKQGRFIVTSSLCGKFGVPKLSAYSASKHALHGFFESLRAEYKPDGIRVTMITAGHVKTDITVHALKGNGTINGKMQASIAGGISPEACASEIVQAVAAGKYEALVGGIEKYSVLIKRFFPGLLRMVITRHPMRKLRNAGLLRIPSYSVAGSINLQLTNV
jgi:dehydrogenase/reductase SDR family member 7B